MRMVEVGEVRFPAALGVLVVAACTASCARPASLGVAASQAASSQFPASQPASSAPASPQSTASGPASSSVIAAPLSASAPLGPAVQKRLWALAVSAATTNGSSVKAAQAVGSTHAHAVAVTMKDGVEGDQPVWVVQIEGVSDFVCEACSVPPGASAPRGRFQVLIVDASTFRTLDFGIDATRTDLSQLGTVVDLHP